MTKLQAAALALTVALGATAANVLASPVRRQCLATAAESAAIHTQAFGLTFIGSDLARMNDCTRF